MQYILTHLVSMEQPQKLNISPIHYTRDCGPKIALKALILLERLASLQHTIWPIHFYLLSRELPRMLATSPRRSTRGCGPTTAGTT